MTIGKSLILEHLSDNKASTERKKPFFYVSVEAEQGQLVAALLEPVTRS
jgi:hypothetical protein